LSTRYINFGKDIAPLRIRVEKNHVMCIKQSKNDDPYNMQMKGEMRSPKKVIT
jgi:hypothetical protein